MNILPLLCYPPPTTTPPPRYARRPPPPSRRVEPAVTHRPTFRNQGCRQSVEGVANASRADPAGNRHLPARCPPPLRPHTSQQHPTTRFPRRVSFQAGKLLCAEPTLPGNRCQAAPRTAPLANAPARSSGRGIMTVCAIKDTVSALSMSFRGRGAVFINGASALSEYRGTGIDAKQRPVPRRRDLAAEAAERGGTGHGAAVRGLRRVKGLRKSAVLVLTVPARKI